MTFADAQIFLSDVFDHVGWAATLSGALLSMTALAAKFLQPSKKESLALWLMGAQSEDSWAKSFCDLFDALFGENHLSWRCIWRSALASLIAVTLMFLLMGSVGLYGLRLEEGLSLWTVLGLALAVNLVADYISLLETRWLLGRLQHVRSVWLQILALLADLVISAAIIWTAIWLITPLLPGQETTTFAETLGLFSVYSVLFYSTFLTSVWSWAYILSTWLLRVFTGLRLHNWIVVDTKPVTILGTTLAALVFFSAKLIAIPLKPDETGLSSADRALCEAFPGKVCLSVAGLTLSEQKKLELLNEGCAVVTDECMDHALSAYKVTPEDAATYWEAACKAGSAKSCTNVGRLFFEGRISETSEEVMARFYEQGCEGGDLGGCKELGIQYRDGNWVEQNADKALELFSRSCSLEYSVGCLGGGYALLLGSGMSRNPTASVDFFSKGCLYGQLNACAQLAILYRNGEGIEQNIPKSMVLFRKSCELEMAEACVFLGEIYYTGRGIQIDSISAFKWFETGCALNPKYGCSMLAILYTGHRNFPAEYEMGLYYAAIACDAEDLIGCALIPALASIVAAEKLVSVFRRAFPAL